MKKGQIYKSMLKFSLAIVFTLFMVSMVHAYQITSELDGLPVDVEATFTLDYANDLLTVEIDNLVVNPVSIIQNLSGLGFALNIIESPTPILADSSAYFRDVAVGGIYSESGPGSTGWELASGVAFPFGTGFKLHVLGTPVGPGYTLIGQPDGSDLYSNANGSIADNAPHNPFIYGPATFVIDFGEAGYDLQEGMEITGVAWFFGTNDTMLVPEPATLMLLGFGLIGLAGIRRKFEE